MGAHYDTTPTTYITEERKEEADIMIVGSRYTYMYHGWRSKQLKYKEAKGGIEVVEGDEAMLQIGEVGEEDRRGEAYKANMWRKKRKNMLAQRKKARRQIRKRTKK